MDGRNEGQKSLNVDIPEESLGVARLTGFPRSSTANFFFPWDSITSHKSGRQFNDIGLTQRAGTTFGGRTLTIDGTNCACGMQAHSS